MRFNKNALDTSFVKSVLVLILGVVFSPSNAQYSISKYSTNSGASTMTGGHYEMSSSIGQADASNKMTSLNYAVNAGYWHENNDLIYKNGVE